MQAICNNWEFTRKCTEAFLFGANLTVDPSLENDPDIMTEPVRIPHNVAEMPLQYGDSSSYEMISGYRTGLIFDRRPGMRYLVHFEGAAHIAEVFLNGNHVTTHKCGYTAFSVDITDYLIPGYNNENVPTHRVQFDDRENTSGSVETVGCLLALRLDSTENSTVPPFGFVIDYLTYGGLYRPVCLEERPLASIEDVFVTTPDLSTVHVETQISEEGDPDKYFCSIEINDMAGIPVSTVFKSESVFADRLYKVDISLDEPKLWSTDDPYLYTLTVCLQRKSDSSEVHKHSVRFGVRTAQFRPDGFYLNGRKLFLRGLNRHQNYPYIGYAATESLQHLDAKILKNELHVNAVRTSHYPQSHDFINACDELGLLVFTEIPGWQHIGKDSVWRTTAIENTREMVLQYRNHPSVILWGVRINESVDDDELYTETNRIAHELDSSRATSGVRYLENSHLLEDVYAFNDFSYTGKAIHEAPGKRSIAAKPKHKVMKKNPDKPLIISESNGHMFPTKPWDTWARREEHALRHARVLNDAMADGQHAGCFEWCMFDYPTHKDFGSGDRVCYHGVTDCFRNPKLAAAVWASQGEPTDGQVVLDVSSNMDIGDYNAGHLGQTYVFTNAEKVRLYKNDEFVTELKPSKYTALPHGPLCVDDTIGCLLSTKEGFSGRKEKLLHKALAAAAKYGIGALPLPDLLRMGWCMLRYGLSYDDGVKLYGKYVGNWGGEAVVWRFDAILNNHVAASVRRSPSSRLKLEVRAGEAVTSHCELHEGNIYDMTLIRVRILDEFDSPAVYASLPVSFSIGSDQPSPSIEVLGPKVSVSQGGATGCIVRTTGIPGKSILTIGCPGLESVQIEFDVECFAFHKERCCD